MYIDTTFPPDGSTRLAAFLSSAAMLGAKELGIAVDALIAKLDALGGDPDLEDDDPAGGEITDEPHDCDGDEEDHNGSEEDFVAHAFTGPGCPIADPGGTDINGGCDQREVDDEDDGATIRAPYRDLIRRTRCSEVRRGRYLTGYRLPSPIRAAGVR